MMLISARRMFVPGGRLARRLARRLGRRTAGSQFFFNVSLSRRLPLCRCRDRVYLRRRGLNYLA